jgi:hypothetical protein
VDLAAHDLASLEKRWKKGHVIPDLQRSLFTLMLSGDYKHGVFSPIIITEFDFLISNACPRIPDWNGKLNYS